MHLGALAHDTAGSPEQIMAVNVLGTWHVLLAAEATGVTRVVHFSSAQVFGIAEGERLPDYFPVDDAHPRRAMRAYGLPKCLAEDLRAGFTARTGIASVSLRPVWVWDPGQYQRIETQWSRPSPFPWPGICATEDVITPHASFLALDIAPRQACANISALRRLYPAAYGADGFFDAVNLVIGAVGHRYLVLDQSMIMAALDNALHDRALQRDFAADPVSWAAQTYLSLERMNLP